jgi:aerobic carbon-monoxide dehydrogenase small subunit
MIVDMTVNGMPRHLQARSGDRLVDVLRKELSLDSLLPDCLAGHCGRCLISMDGRLVHSCLVPAFKARGSVILSYEALAALPEIKDIDKAFESMESPPCPFCRTAKVLVIHSLLAENPNPGEAEILGALSMVDCPCTDQKSLIEAVGRAAEGRSRRIYNRANQ